MARFRLLAALMAVFVIALPAASLADSAGDNQYQDPFSNSAPKHSGTNTNTAPTTTTPPATSTPAPTSNTQPTSAGTSNADPASTDGQLPRTGLDLRLVGGLGVLLLGGGLLVRRRLASDR